MVKISKKPCQGAFICLLIEILRAMYLQVGAITMA